jgi:hypothetical protein
LCLWKTSQVCLLESGGLSLTEFSGTWPRSGMMRNGTAYQLEQSVPRTDEIGFGLLPTPTSSDAKAYHSDLKRFDSLSVELRKRYGYPSYPHPRFVEWMMGFPTEWTALKP